MAPYNGTYGARTLWRWGRFGPQTLSQAGDVPRILECAFPAKNGLVIHFHGGLVPRESGLGIAAQLRGVYEEAQPYPVFLVWESGLVEALRNDKEALLRDPAFREWVKKVSEWVLKRLSDRALVAAWIQQSGVAAWGLRR